MGDIDPMKITVTTQFNEDLIQQTTDIMGHVTRRMMNIREMQADHAIRDALITLGWTPPDGDAFLEGVKAGLEAAAQKCAQSNEIIASRIRAIDPTTITRKGE